jgi:uncharacterized protein
MSIRSLPLILSLILLMSAPAAAQQAERTISVSGEGIVRVAPDRATVRFGIVTRAQDPESARRQNEQASRQAMNAVRALGVEERQIRLETLRLVPAREYDPQTRQWREVGFEVVRELSVELDDIDRLPEVVATVVQQGANRLSSVGYDIRDRTRARNAALTEAVANAREKAALLAGAAGAQLGPVLTIAEEAFDFPRPMFRAEMADVAMQQAPVEPEAYAPGEIEVRARLQVVFRLQ